MANGSLPCKDAKKYIELCRKKRECLANEVEELSNILNGLTNSYRVLVDAAEEFNHISFSSKDDVNDAVNRADDVGQLIDEVIDTLRHKLKEYLKDIKKSEICKEEYISLDIREENLYIKDNYKPFGEEYHHKEDDFTEE
ncbi:hypothetical protein HNQ80_001729 [Anaerosolibacter carboniphilus]|uniref:Uncharacterized protein n=1 Tax=Anaerosolibacter carboniphilus TaxID=1417629 RepID=A0A841KUE3_9FIRM|nr:hypothetical protein [Anaerosolibacter carboniphilus]MBB6215640.1 hypothetical protein [Anaerosolibacter carboniphilus]